MLCSSRNCSIDFFLAGGFGLPFLSSSGLLNLCRRLHASINRFTSSIVKANVSSTYHPYTKPKKSIISAITTVKSPGFELVLETDCLVALIRDLPVWKYSRKKG